MPFLGTLDGTRVIPPQVDHGTTVQCPACDQPMAVVKSYERVDAFVSRHFRHHERKLRSVESSKTGQVTFGDLEASGKCPGESDEHAKMKSIAYARLQHDFPDATVELESGVGDRIADVLVTFDQPRAPYGRGIAVEAQYRNHGKDIDGVTDHYLDRGFSVVWPDEDDFSEYDVDLSEIVTVWPCALPTRTGAEGYPDAIRWLWQEQSPPVPMEIPIPGEYWASFDKSGEWVVVTQRKLRRSGRASATVSRSPTGQLTLQLGKKGRGWSEEPHHVTVQLTRSDCAELRSLADALERKAFGEERPPGADRERPWHDLTTAWFAGSPRVTAWLSASISSDGNTVLTHGKKHPRETDSVIVQIDESAVPALRQISGSLERAFELEMA